MQLIVLGTHSLASSVDGSVENADKSSNALECLNSNFWIRLHAGSERNNDGVQPDLYAKAFYQ